MSQPKKQKMATSREVYHRIIWDSRLDRNVFIAGFQDRISSNGIIEKPLAHWAVNGDIPWHRIRYIRCKDIVVWDREQHLDLISTGHLPAFAWKNNQEDKNVLSIEEKPAIFDKRLVYKYDNQDWQPTEDLSNIIKSKSVKLNSLTIASFNVLCNLYEKSKIKTEKRLPAIIKHLYQCDSDIIAIQEATPALVELLLSQDWVRDYYVSSSITAETIQPFGNLLLSRFPFTLVEHQFSPHKQVLVGSWFINGELLQVGVVHLTSNRAQNAAEKRKHQLTTLLNYLQKQSGNCLIVGDFNTRDNSLEEILTGNNFIDIWQELRPDEAGYTFNPQLNPLAELMSLEGEAARFDRILLHSPNGNLVPDSVNLFACEPVDNTENNIFPSDHFGIRAVITSPRANLENEELQQIYGVSLNKVKPQPFEVRRIINFGEEETILASPELIELVNQLEPKL
ncbi:MAG: RNA repair domain-containing protein, partial [Cyanobacteria bacterium P01_D01_bin.50]